MTNTETSYYGIPRETIEISRRRARRLRTRVVFHLVRRMMRRLTAGRFQPLPARLRLAKQPA